MTMEADGGGGGDRLERFVRPAPWVGAALLWLLPLAAMQVTDEVDWTTFDFMVWGGMLLAACGVCELALRASRNWAYRAGAAVGVGTAFLLVWANLAVGVIGSEEHPANLLYLGVLAIGVAGAVSARLRARGLARALVVMASAHLLIGALALAAGWGSEGENWPQVIIVANGVFAGLWLLSAVLFRRAAREQPAPGAAR